MTAVNDTESLYTRLGGRAAIEALVADFYGRAQEDRALGPVFAAHVEHWPAHIATVADFWSTQTGGPRLYRGGMGRHIRLGLQPEHFVQWLALWESTARSRFPEEVAAELITLARIVAMRLGEMIAGVDGIRLGGIKK